jgi:hypothetical protein
MPRKVGPELLEDDPAVFDGFKGVDTGDGCIVPIGSDIFGEVLIV